MGATMHERPGTSQAGGGLVADATVRLLWAVADPWPDVQAITALIDAGADLPRCARLAHDHQLGPLMWSALDAADRRDRLGAEHDLLRNDYQVHRGRAAMLLPDAVATAITPLVAAGLEPVIVKGPVVADRYPEPGLRPMDDIDLILPPSQFDIGVRAMVGGGWRVIRVPDRDHPYDAALGHPSIPHLPVELHRNLSPWRQQSNRLTAQALWESRAPVECLGTAAYGLVAEDELVYLCAHAGKPFHQFARLIWTVDLKVTLRAAGSAFDWDRVARRARESACTTVVAVGLAQARRLGATVPDELLVLPKNRYRRAALAPVLDESWPLYSNLPGGVLHRMRYAISDLWSRRALQFLGEITEDGVSGIPRHGTVAVARALRRWRDWRRA